MVSRVLLVDDDPAVCDLLQMRLASRGVFTTTRRSASEALELLGTQDFDALVTDLYMTNGSGLELCERTLERTPTLPVVVMTAHAQTAAVISAMRAGAIDFLSKPVDLDELMRALERAARGHPGVRRASSPPPALPLFSFGELCGVSPSMKELFGLLSRIASVSASVLITGESGTGKELVARSIHANSRRAKGPFVAVNCAALPESLLESEFFGHAKGAFTDAKAPHAGLFRQAHGGTLFLDEVGELPLRLQPKLLRALQERAARSIGGTREESFDVRVVAATNRDLDAEVGRGTFRGDLFYRLNVIAVQVPPLRERREDILVYADKFVAEFSRAAGKCVVGLSPKVQERLLSYTWPGNTRELQNCIEHAVALAPHDLVTVEDLPLRLRSYEALPLRATDALPVFASLEQVERIHVDRVISACGGNKTAAARILNVNRRTLSRRFGSEDAEGEGQSDGFRDRSDS